MISQKVFELQVTILEKFEKTVLSLPVNIAQKFQQLWQLLLDKSLKR